MRQFISFLIVFGAVVTMCIGASLGDLKKSYTARYDEANAQRDAQIKTLDANYLRALDRLLEKAKSTGKLETVIPIRDESLAIKNANNPLPPLAKTASLELKNIRGKYNKTRNKILIAHAETVNDLVGKMREKLKSQEIAMTKSGKLLHALAAKQMRESLGNDAGASAARDLLKYGGSKGRNRPALQLRRFGDNLEVLVFRDHRGKISMDSPVENVREKSGEKKELGDTKAKVLGEFVGAKGYEADPYLAYHHVFDGKELGGLSLTSIIPEYSQKRAGQTGVRLSLKPAAVNPHMSFGALLPPNSSKGTYRISTRYFVPKRNQVVAGFMFIQTAGSPIALLRFEKTGKWEQGEAVAESSHDKGTLLLYLIKKKGKKEAHDNGESILLGEMKVEHLKFSAFIQQSFKDSDALPSGSNDPQKQALFISNGEFVKE